MSRFVNGKVIDGKALSAAIKDKIRTETAAFTARYGRSPKLCVILVGDDAASAIYVRNKKRSCEEVGIISEEYKLPADISDDELLTLIDRLNKDDTADGILVQLPLPEHLDEKRVIKAIDPTKDVDCFSPVNTGKLYTGDAYFLPCTPAGIIELIKASGTDISGKICVVIGRSNIVGKPCGALLTENDGTVTICHRKTPDLKEITGRADILVVAIKKPDFITADYIKEGAVVIDVGINRRPDGKVTGDVDFDSCLDKCGFITPVPGGVGPMTVTMLLENTLKAAALHVK